MLQFSPRFVGISMRCEIRIVSTAHTKIYAAQCGDSEKEGMSARQTKIC